MKIKTIIKELQAKTSRFFDNYSQENAKTLEQCRKICSELIYREPQ